MQHPANKHLWIGAALVGLLLVVAPLGRAATTIVDYGGDLLLGDEVSQADGVLPVPSQTNNGVAFTNSYAFSDTVAVSPSSASAYAGVPLYGAFQSVATNAYSPLTAKWINNVENDSLTLSNALNGGAWFSALVFIKQPDFLNLTGGGVSFDSSCSMTNVVGGLNSGTRSVRFAVLSGSQWFLSQSNYAAADNPATIIIPNLGAANFGAWNPVASVNPSNIPSSFTTPGTSLTNIQAVGMWYYRNRAANGNPALTVSRFTVSAVGAPSPVSGSNSTVSVSPASLPADGASLATLTVTLKNTNNVPVTNKTVTVTSNRGAADTILPVSGLSGTNGVVTFTVKSSTSGAPVFTAVGDGVTVSNTVTVTFTTYVSSVSAGASTVSASPLSVPADGASLSTISVTLKNTNNVAITNKVVTVASNRGATDMISPVSGLSDANGVATFTVKSSTSGAPVLTATGDGVTLNQTAVVTFTNGTPSAVSATQSKVWAFAAAVPADGTNQVTVLVTLKDVNDQAVSNKTVTLTRASGPGSPVITTIRGITDLYGVASFTVRSVTPGEVVFAATGDGVSLAPTAVVTFTAKHNRLVPLAGGSNGSNTWWNFQLQGRPFGEFVLEQTPGLNPTAWQPGQAGMADDKGILRSTGLVSGATQFFRARAVPKPNFIFILMDDMSWGDVAAFAHPYAKTPNLDRLATSGTRFNQFYVCGNWCAPTRSSLMTGRLPEKAGIPPTQGLTGNRLNPTLPNVNQLLKTAGYATGHFGKWHLAHGFDQPDDWEHDEYGIDEWSLCYAESPGNGVPAHDALTASNTTAAALEFLDRHAGTPFHMNLWYVWPHVPVNPNAEQVAVYSNLTFNVSDFDPQMQAKYNQIQQLHPGYDMTANMKSYLATISECDKQIGKILDKLDALGLTEDTLVVFSSDNGAVANNITTASSHSMWPASAGPYRGGKFEWYEGGIRMTCLARWPGRLPAGQTNDSLWRTVDWLPTVCALAGVKTGTLTLDGQNVADILLGNQRERTEPIFFGGAMREGRWKHAYGALSDLQTDPSEQTNVAGIYPDQANSMSSLRSQWSANTLPTAIVNGEASPAWGGVVGGGAAYITGSNAVLVARPRSGWHFTAWNDGATNNPRTVVVPATNITFSANFEE